METKNGTKNPLLKTLKDGDVVMVEIPSSGATFKEIVKLKNLKYQPADEKFDFDWLDFDCDILYVNQRVHKDMLQSSLGNCLAITEIIPTDLIEHTARQNDMWRSDLHLMSDAELEQKQNFVTALVDIPSYPNKTTSDLIKELSK
jgi:hypothetical protein